MIELEIAWFISIKLGFGVKVIDFIRSGSFVLGF